MRFQKITFAFILMAVLSQPFAKMGYLTDYIIRYDYYSQKLCVNKYKPQLNCNGKCALAKKLKSTSTNTSSKNKATNPYFSIEIFIAEIFRFECKIYYLEIKKLIPDSVDGTIHYCKSIFQPPRHIFKISLN